MPTLTITKSYSDGDVLYEADLDNIKDDIENFLNVTKINDDNIQNNGITGSTKIADGTIPSAKLGSASVTTSKIADSAVTTDKIADANVTGAKMATNSVNIGNIVDLAVTTAKIAESAVTTSKIADVNVTTAKIANANVTEAKIADGAVTTYKIAAATIDDSRLAAGSVTQAKLATPAVQGVNIYNDSVGPLKLSGHYYSTTAATATTPTTLTVTYSSSLHADGNAVRYCCGWSGNAVTLTLEVSTNNGSSWSTVFTGDTAAIDNAFRVTPILQTTVSSAGAATLIRASIAGPSGKSIDFIRADVL